MRRAILREAGNRNAHEAALRWTPRVSVNMRLVLKSIAMPRLLIALLIMTSQIGTRTTHADKRVDVEWRALIGGIHQILDICIPDAGDIWVSGSGIARLDSISRVLTVTDWAYGLYVNRIVTDGVGTGWAIANTVGDEGDAYLLRLEGGRIVERIAVPSATLADLSVSLASGEGWAVGWDRTNTSALFMRLQNGQWSRRVEGAASAGSFVESWLNALDVVSPDLAAAVTTSGIVWIWDGLSWSQKFAAPPSEILRISDIELISVDELWLAGGQNQEAKGLLHLKSSSWAFVTDSAEAPLHSIEITAAGDGWVVGRAGAVHQIRGGVMRLITHTLPYGEDLNSLWTVRTNTKRGLTLAGGDAGQLVTLANDQADFFGDANRDGHFSSVLQLGQGDMLLGGANCDPPFCGLRGRGGYHASILHYSSGQIEHELLPETEGVVFDLIAADANTILALTGALAIISNDAIDHGTVLRKSADKWEVATRIEGFGLRRIVALGDDHFMALGMSYARYPESILIELDHFGREVGRTLLPGVFGTNLAVDGSRRVIVGGTERDEQSGIEGAVVVHWTSGLMTRSHFPEGQNAVVVVSGRGTPWALVNTSNGIETYRWDGGDWDKSGHQTLDHYGVWSSATVGEGACLGTAMGYLYCEEDGEWKEYFSVTSPQTGPQLIADISSMPLGDGRHQVVIVGDSSLVANGIIGTPHEVTPTQSSTATPTVAHSPTPTAIQTTRPPEFYVSYLPVLYRRR